LATELIKYVKALGYMKTTDAFKIQENNKNVRNILKTIDESKVDSNIKKLSNFD
jgi:hypothetical protein